MTDVQQLINRPPFPAPNFDHVKLALATLRTFTGSQMSAEWDLMQGQPVYIVRAYGRAVVWVHRQEVVTETGLTRREFKLSSLAEKHVRPWSQV